MLDYKKITKKCIWIIDSKSSKESPNLDAIFDACEFDLVTDADTLDVLLTSVNLFEEKKYKFIYKNGVKLFSQSREFWQTQLIIKGSVKEVDASVDSGFGSDDHVIDISKYSFFELIKMFCSLKKMEFEPAEYVVISKLAQNLWDISLFHLLKISNFHIKEWSDFVNAEAISWYRKFKNKTLISDMITGDSNMVQNSTNKPMSNAVPMLQYLIKADGDLQRKAISQFLVAGIKSGTPVWNMSAMWKELVEQIL